MNTQQFIQIDGADFVVVKTYTNDEDQMQSFVVGGLKGWHVCLKDLDSEEFLPQVKIFPYDKFATDAAAKDHARFLVYGPRSQDDTPSLDVPWFAHQ